MTSKQKVLARYPDADHLSRRMMGVTFYVIVESPNRRMVIGEAIGSAGKAWTDARKNMEAGKPLYPLSR